MKVKYYTPYDTDEERLCHQPLHLLDDEWRWLIHFWGMPEAKVNIMIFFFIVYVVIYILT